MGVRGPPRDRPAPLMRGRSGAPPAQDAGFACIDVRAACPGAVPVVRHSAHARGRRVAFLRWSRRRGECQRRRSHLSAAFHFATFGSPAVSQAWPGSSGVILFLAFLFLLPSCTMCGWAARRCLEATLRVSRALVRTFLPFGAGFISIFPFSLVYIALGAIPGSPQLRILTALNDLPTSREFIYSVCNFVDALAAIYQLRVLVRYVCTRYVCTPSLPPLPPSR